MKPDALIFFEGVHYTNANITDAIAKRMLKRTVLESQFKTYPDGYAPKSDAAVVANAKIALANATKSATEKRKALQKAEAVIGPAEEKMNETGVAVDVAKTELESNPDDKELKKRLATAEDEHKKSVDEHVKAVETVSRLSAAVEEAEAEITKQQELYDKRGK